MIDSDPLQRLFRFLYGKSKLIAESISALLQNRWIRFFLQALIISFSVLYLIRNFQSIDLSKLDLRLDYSKIGWSIFITLGALLFGGLGWWFTLTSVGQKIELIEAIRIHLVSNLAKYIPGYAWQLLSKGYLTRRSGAPTIKIGASMTLELAQIFLTGIWLIVLFFPYELAQSIAFIHDIGEYTPYIKIGLLGIISMFPVLIPAIVKCINPVAAKIQISTYPLIFATLSILAGWILFGFAFWLLGNAVQPISEDSIPLFIYTLAISFLIGLLIIIIPASIGVRESLMVLFLSNLLPAPIAVIIATLSRLVLTICELLSAVSILLYARMKQNRL